MQIKNNPKLLNLLMGDMEIAPDEWRPTPYWQGYSKRIYSRLQAVGIEGFRTDWEIIKGHGQIDPTLPPTYEGGSLRVSLLRILSKTPFFSQISNFYMKKVNAEHGLRKNTHDQLVLAITQLLASDLDFKRYMDLIKESGAGLPNVLVDDLDNFSIDFLLHFAQLLTLDSTIGALQMRSVLEIGGGHGKFAEIFIKLAAKPDLTYCLIDIPPVLYLATEYLRSIFPDRVIDYDQASKMNRITEEDIRGKILIIPPWLIDRLEMKFDLFWNSASFQEMEKSVVVEYLDRISNICQCVGLKSLVKGHALGAGGQLEPISLDWLSDEVIERKYSEIPVKDQSAASHVNNILNPLYKIRVFKKDN
jgi:putative sugar O-methyltransferase